jgi:hypothetical protein
MSKREEKLRHLGRKPKKYRELLRRTRSLSEQGEGGAGGQEGGQEGGGGGGGVYYLADKRKNRG